MTGLSLGVSDDSTGLDGRYEQVEEAAESIDEEGSENEDLDGTMTYKHEPFVLWDESKLLFNIALPAVAVQVSVLFIFPLTASVVGRNLGTNALAGFSLGSLVGNLTCTSVMVGCLTAADTLMPRAYGTGNYKELGRLAIRGFVICSLLLLVPIVPLFTIMEWVFVQLGQDEYASHLASQWIRYYLIGLPAILLFRVIQSFLNAQHQVWPLVYASVAACFVVHPFFLKIFIPAFGFVGSSLAIAMTQFVMAFFLLLSLKIKPVHKAETWPGLSKQYFMEAISPRPMARFFSLGMGGVLSYTEWWFWETNCFIVGSFGVVPLCVHTIAYNLVPLLFMIPLGISIGLTVRMGNIIAYDVPRAKLLASWCMGFTVIVATIVSLLLYHFQVEVAMLFSSDPEIIQGCRDIWPKLCYYIFVIYIFGTNSAILRALGMQWELAAVIFICLWLCTLPAIVFFAIKRGGGIDSVWNVLPIFYTIMQVILVRLYTNADWHKISREIGDRARQSVRAEATAGLEASEGTHLLAGNN